MSKFEAHNLPPRSAILEAYRRLVAGQSVVSRHYLFASSVVPDVNRLSAQGREAWQCRPLPLRADCQAVPVAEVA